MNSSPPGHGWRPGSWSCVRLVVQAIRNASQKPHVVTAAANIGLIGIWYILSTCLGIYNKTLVGKGYGIQGKGNFPAPLFMSGVQFGFQYLLAKMVFGLQLVERSRESSLDWPAYWRVVVPNGVITGMDIGFSNKSLVYITMSFYTMCKSTVPIFLLMCAFIWRIERPSWELAGVVAVISGGLVLLVEGESHFDLMGFLLVMSASAMSGIRFTLTQVSLHGHGDAVSMGGPLEVLELLTPIMSISALSLSVVWEQVFEVLPKSPYLATVQEALATLAIVGVGAMIAFLMVWTEYKVIKETSALTFMIAGTCKEVVTVLVAVMVFHDKFGLINGIGLVIVILGVVLFNVHKWRKMQVGPQDVAALQLVKADGGPEEELVPLIVAASGSQQPSAGGLTSSNYNKELQNAGSSSAGSSAGGNLDSIKVLVMKPSKGGFQQAGMGPLSPTSARANGRVKTDIGNGDSEDPLTTLL